LTLSARRHLREPGEKRKIARQNYDTVHRTPITTAHLNLNPPLLETHLTSAKLSAYVYPPDAEPYISNSGDLTRDKIAKLIEMVIDNT
jgi:hypothetical protein